MRHHRFIALALLLLVAAAVSPRPAAAQGHPVDGGMWIFPLVAGTTAGLAVTGLVTDVGISIDLGVSGHVGHGWSVTGTVVWSLLAIADWAVTYANPQWQLQLANPSNLAVTAVCLGSLGYSIFALTRPPTVAVAPAAFALPGGGRAAGLVVAGHF